MAKKYYLKERHNPQFKKPYYTKEGLLSKTEARRREKAIYGENFMLPYDTEEDYMNAIEKLKSEGFNIHL